MMWIPRVLPLKRRHPKHVDAPSEIKLYGGTETIERRLPPYLRNEKPLGFDGGIYQRVRDKQGFHNIARQPNSSSSPRFLGPRTKWIHRDYFPRHFL